MFRLRAAKSCIIDRLAALAGSREQAHDTTALHMAELTSAIHSREVRAIPTTLRQLHRITDLSQSEALAAIDRLERLGVVEVESSLSDAFESKVTLKQEARNRMDRAVRDQAA